MSDYVSEDLQNLENNVGIILLAMKADVFKNYYLEIDCSGVNQGEYKQSYILFFKEGFGEVESTTSCLDLFLCFL